MDIRIWEDTPKRGETYSGWFYSIAREGHVVEIRGGFATKAEAGQAANYKAIGSIMFPEPESA